MNAIATTVWLTLKDEFADIADVEAYTRIVIRLLIAVMLGGMLGYERERSGKAAGLRTHMLVSLGAALFVLAPLEGDMGINDLSRVLQGVIAGIGFLGAGAIIKFNTKAEVKGLTTAASIWLAAAIGVAAGMGREIVAIISALLALVILDVLHRLERRMYGEQRARRRPPSDDDA